MTTTVYKLASKDSLVCHLRSTTPNEAIEKLQKAGVLAIEGAEENSIVLVGYRVEVRRLLDYFRTQELAFGNDRYFIGKLKSLATSA
jgi:hypothetical protein